MGIRGNLTTCIAQARRRSADAESGHEIFWSAGARGVNWASAKGRAAWCGRSQSPDGWLRSRAVRVRLIRIRVHDPTLRAATANDAPKKHRAVIARHTVIVPGHIAIDPAPHKSSFSEHRCPAKRQGRCHHARAVALAEIMRRIAYQQLRLKVEMAAGSFELARQLTHLQSSFTTEAAAITSDTPVQNERRKA